MNAPTFAIVDDDKTLRATVVKLLTASGTVRLAGSYHSGEEALAALTENAPDIILMDINLPGMSGIECTARIKAAQPLSQILMLTVYEDEDRIFEALAAGASGYLLKRDAASELATGIQQILAGGSPISASIARKIIQHFQKPAPLPQTTAPLSARETEIINFMARGYLYKEIANELNLSIDTIRTYLRRICEKLHARSRTEAVAKYLGGKR